MKVHIGPAGGEPERVLHPGAMGDVSALASAVPIIFARVTVIFPVTGAIAVDCTSTLVSFTQSTP